MLGIKFILLETFLEGFKCSKQCFKHKISKMNSVFNFSTGNSRIAARVFPETIRSVNSRKFRRRAAYARRQNHSVFLGDKIDMCRDVF